MKLVFIAKHRSIWPVAWMCDALGVSRSGFHAWLGRKPSRRAKEDEAIGAVWDNSAMESFFSLLKTERTASKTYRMRDQARADVFDYVERFYNAVRRHSTLGYISPIEFETKVGLA